MSLKIALLTRSSRPSGAQMAWRLLQAGYQLTVFVEKRSKAITGRNKGRLILTLLKLGPFFLLGRAAEALKIRAHFYLRKWLGQRFKSPVFWSIEELALNYSLRMYWVDDHNGPDAERLLDEMKPDIGVLTNTRRIRSNILSIPRLGFLNLHMSALPQYAGLDSIFWALYHGEKEIGVTVHAVVPELDRGDIVLQRKIPVHFLDTEESLYDRALWLGTALMARAVKQIEEGNARFIPQDDAKGSYHSWPSTRDRARLRLRRKAEAARLAEGRPKSFHIITRMTRGGAQENTLATVAYLQKLEYDVLLITGPSWSREGEILSEAIESGVPVMILPELCREIRPFDDILALCKLMAFMKRARVSLVHTHTSKAGLLGRLAAFLCKVPLIVHTPHGHVFHSYFSLPKAKLFLLLERMASFWCHAMIALTESEKKEHSAARVGAPGMWHVIPSGVNEKKFDDYSELILRHTRQKLGIPEPAKIVAFVGRLALIKGPRYFVEAMPLILQKYPETRFLMVGDGDELPFLEQRVRALGITDRVCWAGQTDRVAEYFALADVLVVPSLNEGMGRVIVEAGLYAKPVVASKVGGIPDLIRHHETGWLVTPRNAAEIANAVNALLGDEAQCRRLGAALEALVMENYTEDCMVEKIEALYRGLEHENHR